MTFCNYTDKGTHVAPFPLQGKLNYFLSKI